MPHRVRTAASRPCFYDRRRVRPARAAAAVVRRPRARPAVAARRQRRPGGCWSRSSCCSRRRWRACCRCTTPGWRAGHARPTSRPSRPVRRSARGAGSATRAVRSASTPPPPRSPEQLAGEVPDDYDSLRALPGVGDYTASAVLAFAFGRRQPVLDTNVRRVLARVVGGQGAPARRGDRRREDGRRRAAARRRADRGDLVGRPDGARRAGVLRGLARGATTARCADACAWRARRLPGVRRAARAAARPGPAPTGSAEAG